MNSFRYYNPVQILFSGLDRIPELMAGRKAALITSKHFMHDGAVRKITDTCGFVKNIGNIAPNPDFESLARNYNELHQQNAPQLLVALGGGSVMDAAKVFSVNNSGCDFRFVEGMIRGTEPKKNYSLTPIIAIPTTAGTGSEVTPWATVWDNKAHAKFSLHLEDLWCETALCVPELTLSLPLDLTVTTALDALSHALESIWNKNANPISTAHAIEAARMVITALPELRQNLNSLPLRSAMMLASVKAGLAFSNTQTALAHAVSYWMTANKGLAHGLACSFTLPFMVKAVYGQNPGVDEALHVVFGLEPLKAITDFFKTIKVSIDYKDYGLCRDDMCSIRDSLSNVQRSGNSLVNSENFFKLIL